MSTLQLILDFMEKNDFDWCRWDGELTFVRNGKDSVSNNEPFSSLEYTGTTRDTWNQLEELCDGMQGFELSLD